MTTGARNTDPSTSHQAAKSVNINKREQDVVDALARIGEGNAWDICSAIAGVRGTDEIPSNITPRIACLIRKNRVTFTGRLSKSPMGKSCRIYRLTEKVQFTAPLAEKIEEGYTPFA